MWVDNGCDGMCVLAPRRGQKKRNAEVSTAVVKGGVGVGNLMKVTRGIDLSRPRNEIVVIGLGLATFWAGVLLKLLT